VPREELTVNQAVNRLITAFDARGWREDGETALAIARAAAGEAQIGAGALASAVKSKFLLANGIDRSAITAVIEAALSNAIVVSPEVERSPQGDTHINVRNSGTMIGTFGGGIVSGVEVHQQQVVGDEAIRSLVGEYRGRPDVRQIIDSDLPVREKRSRLTTIVQGLGTFASDTLAKIVTGLMTHS
jgi:hypothetical protein